MASPEIELQMLYRAKYEEKKDDQHVRFATKLSKIGEPFGFDIGECPKFGKDTLAFYPDKCKAVKGLRYYGMYRYKSELNREEYYSTFGKDETFEVKFRISNKELNYKEILHIHYPKLIDAYMPYKAVVYFADYFYLYVVDAKQNDPMYQKLELNPTIKINWRNNIYTLHPAQFWDKELCELALGYSPEEVIKRLNGVKFNGAPIPLVMPLLDGVYIVLNDDPKLDYETFVAMNRFYKDILGLI